MLADIPLYLVEEHHEVFPFWLQYCQGKEPMTLLHVDAHSDLQPGHFASGLQQLPDDKKMLRNIVRNEFHFDDFILPAVYLGFFNRIIWLRPKILYGNTDFSVSKYVRSWRNRGTQLILGNGKLDTTDSVSDTRPFILEAACFNGENFPCDFDILDIEYDFFYCVQSPCIAQRIEITEQEFSRYESDTYHFARLHFRTKTEEKDGRFFLVFYPWDEAIPGALEVNDETVIQSVHHFCDDLQRVAVVPKLITLCRARHSGYCPARQSQLIENILLNFLTNISFGDKKVRLINEQIS
ncbi:MAG: UPF0489 family protein [Planctomycetaceae bacterium]|jgi:hypothetical protein|nr:UPF0489 family protein [Planctomycetaceae bacterium]